MAAAESHLLPVYAPPEQVFVRGEGCWIWDEKGDKYLDCIAGIAVNALGHAPPVLVKALTEQAGKLWHTSNMFKIKGQEELADEVHARTRSPTSCSSPIRGTEAIEGALKTGAQISHARTATPERIDIIGFQGSFHGRSYAAINASGNPAYLEGFGPRLPGYRASAVRRSRRAEDAASGRRRPADPDRAGARRRRRARRARTSI